MLKGEPGQKLPQPQRDLYQAPVLTDWKPVDRRSSIFDSEPAYDQSFYEMQTWILPVIPGSYTRSAAKAPVGTGSSHTENHVAVLRKLLKTTGIYAIASFLSPLLALILSPFLAHSLSYTDFGALAVLTTFIALMAGITQLGLSSAFFRAYSWDYQSARDRLAVVSTTLMLMLIGSGLFLAIFLAIAPLFVGVLLNSPAYTSALRLAVLVIFMQNLTVPGFAWLRAENRAVYYSMLTALQWIVTLATTLLLVGRLHMGVVGAIIATGSGYAVIIVCTLPLLIVNAGLLMNSSIVKNLLAFGLPIMANFVSSWVLQFSDRYLLSRMVSLPVTANYAVAYSLGGVLAAVVLGPFSLAWPPTMYAIAAKKDAAQSFRQVFRWFAFVLLFAAFGLALVSTIVLHLLYPPGYSAAAPIIPIITLSITFYGIYLFFTVGIALTRKNWFIVIFTICCGLINVGLNFELIPRFGSMGAALSTLLAYILLAVVTYYTNQRIYPIPFEIGLFMLALTIGLILYIAAIILTATQPLLITDAIFLCMLAVYGGSLFLLVKLPSRQDRHNVKPHRGGS